MLVSVSGTSRYSIWWQLADNDDGIMNDCEIMMQIFCHASLLKSDDVRLKRLPIASKVCTLCDHEAYDDANHMVMQCPKLQPYGSNTFEEIAQI